MTKTREARLRTKAHQAVKKTFPEKTFYRLDRFHIWYWMILTNCGKKPLPKENDDPGRLIFFRNPFEGNPWAKRLAKLKPNPNAPRILITGRLQRSLGIDPLPPNLLSDINLRHHLQNVRLEFTRDISCFWEKFYGTEKFFTKEARDVPSLILMEGDGSMKNYPREGGEWLQVDNRLAEIAKFYQIPIEPMESYVS